MMAILGYIGALITGISLGLIGGGGSILIVPILVYLFSVNPTLATAYSLFIVGLAAAIGAVTYAKRQLIQYQVVAIFAVPSLIGVLLARTWLIPSLPDTVFTIDTFQMTKDRLIMVVFAVVMLAASLSMIRKKKGESQDEDRVAAITKEKYPLIALEGLLVGGITGFVGAGGGFLIIPALVILAKLSMKQAVGTSLMIIAVKSLLGFLGDLGQSAHFDWTLLTIVTLLSVLGIFIGNILSKKIPGQVLKPAFGWFVLVMGTYILAKQLF